MECPSCGKPNREGARFCAECGEALIESTACPSCGSANPAGTKYCDSCGQALASTGAPAAWRDATARPPEHLAEKIRADRPALEGERKQVTVLFADVVGSMELAERTDPEEWRRILDRFFSILCEGVNRFEGTVDKFTGDGVMALFGAPIAREDHARRACYAALHLQHQLAEYATELRREQGLSLSVRMGLNAGEVVVGAIGEDLAMDYTAIGHTVGLAERMEQLAEPGKVYLTQEAASLVEGYLAIADLGEFQVKGASHALHVYELTGVGAVRGRLELSRARGFSRFVGRTDEMGMLESALEQSLGGEAQVMGIVGEAGVGKSRLCHEFTERHRARGVPIYHVAGQAHAKSVPLMPVLQLMRDYFGITDRDSDQAARERIAGKMLLLDRSFDEHLPLIFDFLAVPDPELPLPGLDPEERQQALLALTKRLIRATHAREPGINVFEDLHWLDPASEMFLAHQVEAVQGTRSLTVLNFRPEYHAPWMERSYYRQIALAPLGPEATDELLRDLLGADPSLDSLTGLVRERTQGNPFFVEEVVQSLVEAGSVDGERGAYRLARTVDEAAVPASVKAVLGARIDRLEARDKQVLQAAAVIGKEFPQPVLQRVVEIEPTELEHALRDLVAGEFVYEQELYPETLFAFKHPLTQEVAYGSQLSERRAHVHAAVARAIIELYPDRLDERAALLAQHWEAAGETLEAARWHARTATWSGSGDPAQALVHWRRVRELADTLPASEEAVSLGLAARHSTFNYGLRLGMPRDEAQALLSEGDRMASQLGDDRSRAIMRYQYGAFSGLGTGDVREYARLASEALAIAEESGDPAVYLGISPAAYGLFCVGDYRGALAVSDRAIELADGDPGVGAGVIVACGYAWCIGNKGFNLVVLGELEEGRRLIELGRHVAGEQGDIETVGFSHTWSTWLAYIRGDPDSGLAFSEQALEIAERIGSTFSRSWAWYFYGLAERMRGEWQRAIDALERSLAISRERQTALEGEAMRLAMLSESYLGAGEPERARALAEDAVAISGERGHAFVEPHANLALARVLLGSTGIAAEAEITAALARAKLLVAETGATSVEPLIHIELAELARQGGNEEQREREIRAAHRAFAEMGANARADRLAADFALISR